MKGCRIQFATGHGVVRGPVSRFQEAGMTRGRLAEWDKDVSQEATT